MTHLPYSIKKAKKRVQMMLSTGTQSNASGLWHHLQAVVLFVQQRWQLHKG
jgi:hypothetical protein